MNHDSPEIINKILDFWQTVPASVLQGYAERGELEKAAKHWAPEAQAFYHQFADHSSEPAVQILWNEWIWRFYHSVLLVSSNGAVFCFPKDCVQLQGMNRSFMDTLLHHWQVEDDQTLARFLHIIDELQRALLVELSADELVYVKSIPRSLTDPMTQTLGWLAPQFYAKETHFSSNRLRKALQRLGQDGIIQMRAYVNYARLGWHLFLSISPWPLDGLRAACCFWEVGAPESQTKFRGIALPPETLTPLATLFQGEGAFEPIISFSTSWNLARLSANGWGAYPPLATAPPPNASFGQLTLEFQCSALPLRVPDLFYLERAQTCSLRMLHAEFGLAGQQRLRELRDAAVLGWSPMFQAIGCSAALFFFCRAPPSVLDRLQNQVVTFPRTRLLRGAEWLLGVLSLPPAWVPAALTDLQAVLAAGPFHDVTLAVQEGSVERLISLAKLWTPSTA